MATNKKPPNKAAALALAICIPLTAGFEGLRQYVYRDPVGIPTFCFGETANPQWGRTYSIEECTAILSPRVAQAIAEVQSCTTAELSPQRLAALGSFAYNVGGAAYCKSTLNRRINAGDPNACQELDRWVNARGVKLPGLVKRRAEERKLCES
mgnify:FL=1